MIPRGKFLRSWRAASARRALNRAERRALARSQRRRRAGALASAALVTSSLIAPAVASAATVKPEDVEFHVTRHDLEFILRQIRISENHAMGGDLLCETPTDLSGTCVPDPKLPWGLRTVDGSYNNLMPGQSQFGAGGEVFPRLTEPQWRDGESYDPDGPYGPAGPLDTSYAQTDGYVIDSEPRIISNLIVDQTATNEAAVAAIGDVEGATRYDHDSNPETPDRVFIPNVSPDEGLSAPFNSWFTLFGQFFDHGLDLVSKGGSGTVMVPLQPDDPLYDPAKSAFENSIMLTRATNQPGPDKVLGTDDDIHEHTNRTTPFVDQNQTYTSHPSHQFFLREYQATENGPVPTGHLLDSPKGGLANWADIKRQAREVLGIELDDMDVLNVPMVATDPYGRFIPGPNGMPQLVIEGETEEGNTLLEASLANPVDASLAMDAGHAFLDDIAHAASPVTSRGATLARQDDGEVGAPGAILDGVYDNELLDEHYITGDGRGNENIGLTAVHHVFHAEHNRMVGHIEDVLEATGDQDFIDQWRDESGVWDYGERLFQAARFVTEMEYQHLVFEEFARKIQPNIDAQPLNETAYHADIDPAVTAEFAHVVYRFGHSMLTDDVDRLGFGTDSLPLLDAFLNPLEFTDGGRLTADEGAAAIIQGMTRQTGNGIDEFVVDTLRNELLGLPLDLAAINLIRGRETGMPTLQKVRETFYAESFDSSVKPYESWEDFRLAMKHRGSIVNFVAAYGNHPSLEEATTVAAKREAAKVLIADAAFMARPAAESGLNDVDFWIGGLAESEPVFGGMLGTTFNYVFEEHLEDLQNADRFYYLNRNQGLNLFHQLEANSFSELVMRNTDATMLPADLFAQPDLRFDLKDLSDPLPDGLVREPNGTYRFDGAQHIVLEGTDGDDKLRGGDGDDSLWGHKGNDHIEGGVGNDVHHGGHGDDILTDTFGDDTMHGGDGDDAINGGSGLDLLFGGAGRDFILHGQDITQSFAGAGDDLVRGGNANDILTGNEGDDWLEGGGGHDLVQGDNALTFQNDPYGGADVLFGGSGNDDHDAEGGDDIMLNNGIDRHAGMLGFDWVTHQHNPFAADSDLDISVFMPLNPKLMRERYMNIEGLSGWKHNDVLRGRSDGGDPANEDRSGHELTQEHLSRITGFREMLSSSDEPEEVPTYATPHMITNEANDILLGGAGSDLIEGRGGDDYIDGDAQLEVYLEGPDGERHTTMAPFQTRIFAGELKSSDIRIVREIVTPEGQDDVIDTAVYEDVRENHVITDNGDGTWRVAHVEEDAGGAVSGVDTLRNIERLVFADGVVELTDVANGVVSGTIRFSTMAPVEDQPITAIPAFSDPDGIQEDTISYTWQWADDEGEWTTSESDGSATFTPGDAEAGWPLRVIATFQDGQGTLETVTSVTTLPVRNVNDAPTGLTVSNLQPSVGDIVTATGLVDADGTHNDDGDLLVQFRYQWQQGDGTTFTNIAGAASESFTVTEAQHGKQLRVIVTYTDVRGTAERAVSEVTAPVHMLTAPGAPAIVGTVAGNGSATVTWSPPADNGGSDVTGYEVRVYAGGELVDSVDGLAANATSVVVPGLVNGTAYTFTVRALNALGAGAESAASSPVTPVAPVLVAPAAPTNASATAGNASATVAWAAPANDGGSPITGYEVVVRRGNQVVRTVTGLPAGATSTTVRELTNGTTYTFTVRAVNAIGASADSAPSAAVTPTAPVTPPVTPPPATARSGYWMVQADGKVHAFGQAAHLGDAQFPGGTAEDIEPTPSGNGYWVVSSRGVVQAFGDARRLAGGGTLERDEHVTSISATKTGQGYWLFTSKGRVINRGDAVHHGDMAGVALNGPVLEAVTTPSGKGYYMVASDGGVFTFGDAGFHGSMGGKPLNAPVQALVPDGDGHGYWLVASDGGVFAFDAGFHGSMGGQPLNKPVTGMVGFGSAGYLMVAEDGGVFSFGSAQFHGSLGGQALSAPVTSIAILAK